MHTVFWQYRGRIPNPLVQPRGVVRKLLGIDATELNPKGRAGRSEDQGFKREDFGISKDIQIRNSILCYQMKLKG